MNRRKHMKFIQQKLLKIGTNAREKRIKRFRIKT